MNRADKLEDLKTRIAEKGKLLVAYSGGVDSSLLASVAHDVLGDRGPGRHPGQRDHAQR